MKRALLILSLIFLVPVSDEPILPEFLMPVLSIKKDKNAEYITVRVTMYSTEIGQTDETPYETASGFLLDSINPKKHRVIAVSRDIKRKVKFGQRVRVAGIGKYDGIYVVRDLMHPRWKKKIDILINPGEEARVFRGARLYINVKEKK